MADTKITGLTANTTPLSTDVTVIIDDPAGVALSQKITLANLMALFANPVSDDGDALGTSALRWSDADFASGAVIRFNNDETITHAADTLTVAGAGLVLAAGTTTYSPLNMPSGTLETTPEAGDHEYDGTAFYRTADITSGRTQDCAQNIFRLAANGSAIGPTIADYFGANSSFPFVTNGVYEFFFYLWYLKSTAGTVVYELTNTQTYGNIVGGFLQSPAAAGIGTIGNTGHAGIAATTTAAAAFPATTSLASAVNHAAIIRAVAECGTAGDIRLRVTSSAGTITPLRGSYYTARRLFAGNVGIFVA